MPLPLLVEQAVTEMRDDMLRPQLNALLELVYEQAGDASINLERVTDNRYFISEGIEPLVLPAIFIVVDRSEHDLEWNNAAIQTHVIHVAALFEDFNQMADQRQVQYPRTVNYEEP